MQVSNKFTIALHVILAIDYFKDREDVTSSFLAESVGTNPVTIRNVMGDLKKAGIIDISQGKTGISLGRDLSSISFYDVYQALDLVEDEGLFNFHDKANPQCPVGKNIHQALDGKLNQVQRAMEDEMKKISLDSVSKDLNQAILDSE